MNYQKTTLFNKKTDFVIAIVNILRQKRKSKNEKPI